MKGFDTVRFNSITELGEHVQMLEQNPDLPRAGNASRDTYNPENYGNMDMSTAITTALNGGNWQEGADAMPKLEVPHETLSGGAIPEQAMFSDVQGFAPIVPAYLAGLPDNMLAFDEVEVEKRLKIGVQVGRRFDSEQHHALNKGAAIMSVLSQLALEGYSLEIWAIWRNQDGMSKASIETCIKTSDTPFSSESIAFSLAHVAFQRRLCWRVAESLTDGGEKMTLEGYGNGKDSPMDDFDIGFGYLSNKGKYSTPEKAVATIKELALEQLQGLEK